MCECSHSSSIDFFDSLALRWDGLHDLNALSSTLDAGLVKFGVLPDEYVLDVGCGTGNLTAALIRRFSLKGMVTAIDLSSVMIETAKAKLNDSRITWVCGAVEQLDVVEASLDRIICYSVWPHLTDNHLAGLLFNRWLKPGGKLHIWHTVSRQMVNQIHSKASASVSDHLLAPALQTKTLLDQLGFTVDETKDDDTGYLISARKV